MDAATTRFDTLPDVATPAGSGELWRSCSPDRPCPQSRLAPAPWSRPRSGGPFGSEPT